MASRTPDCTCTRWSSQTHDCPACKSAKELLKQEKIAGAKAKAEEDAQRHAIRDARLTAIREIVYIPTFNAEWRDWTEEQARATLHSWTETDTPRGKMREEVHASKLTLGQKQEDQVVAFRNKRESLGRLLDHGYFTA